MNRTSVRAELNLKKPTVPIVIQNINTDTNSTFADINNLKNVVEDYNKLEQVLEKLCQEGKIYYSEKKKRYTPIENTNFKTGRLIVNSKGYGFVVLDPSFNEDDIYINGSNLLDARNNDIVIIEIINKGSREGKVVRVLKRDDSTLVGEVYQKEVTFSLAKCGGRYIPSISLPSSERLKYPTALRPSESVLVPTRT